MISSNFSQLKFFLEGVWGNPFSRKKKVSPEKSFFFSRKSQLGSTAVEAALVLPLFFFLLFAGLEFGRVMWVQNVLADAAAEGARMAILHEPTDADVVGMVEQVLSRQGVTGDHSVTIGARNPAQPVIITVTAAMDLAVLPTYLAEATNLANLSATSVMTHSP
jgi:Flp pilus assembly protein TadG